MQPRPRLLAGLVEAAAAARREPTLRAHTHGVGGGGGTAGGVESAAPCTSARREARGRGANNRKGCPRLAAAKETLNPPTKGKPPALLGRKYPPVRASSAAAPACPAAGSARRRGAHGSRPTPTPRRTRTTRWRGGGEGGGKTQATGRRGGGCGRAARNFSKKRVAYSSTVRSAAAAIVTRWMGYTASAGDGGGCQRRSSRVTRGVRAVSEPSSTSRSQVTKSLFSREKPIGGCEGMTFRSGGGAVRRLTSHLTMTWLGIVLVGGAAWVLVRRARQPVPFTGRRHLVILPERVERAMAASALDGGGVGPNACWVEHRG